VSERCPKKPIKTAFCGEHTIAVHRVSPANNLKKKIIKKPWYSALSNTAGLSR
jgi:hypothetical protein